MAYCKQIPNPSTIPRIETRKSIEKISQNYQSLTVLFWDFFQQHQVWRENIEERLKAIERMPRG